MIKGTGRGPKRCDGVGRAGHPSWVGKTGRQVREGFLEEVASEPMKGKSVIQGRRGERACQGSKNSRHRGK